MIKISHIYKNYGQTEALCDVSFEVQKGELVGLLGPNGAGKSTTMKIITGYIPATKGKVIINDKDISTHKQEIQKLIGYLPENCPLYEDLTINEYLEYTAQMKGLQNLNEEIERVLKLCSLLDRRHMIISQLSKGYKQRTGLAGALLGNPEILILDEPTSGLDPNQILEIRKLLSNIAIETKATIILSTHIMQEAESMCDRVIIISEGKMVADDKISNLSSEDKKGIEIEFETTLTITETKAILVNMDKIIDYKAIDKRSGRNVFRVSFDMQNEDIPEIIEKLIKAKVPIFKFVPYEESLETIFATLTKK